MILLTPEQLYEKIQESDLKYLTWFEGYISNPRESKTMFHRFRGDSVADALADARKILERYNTDFTVSMMRSDKTGSEPPTVCRVKGSGAQGAQMQGTQQPQQQYSYQDMYNKVLEDVKKEMETQRLKNEIENLKNQLNGIQSQGDKLAYVGLKIVEGIMNKNPQTRQAIQGIENAKEIKENMEENKQPEPPKNKEALGKAFDKLYALMGEDLLIQVADKLEANPDKVALIKTFI